jgi:tetratricopeptide (TPR) repeat protein
MNSAQRPGDQSILVARLFKEAVTLHQGGRLLEAAQRYRAVLAMAPDHAATLPLLGVALAQQGQNEEAADILGKALRLNPNAAELHNNLGMVLHALKRYDEAAEHYRQAIALNPRYAIAHNNLGNSLSSLDRRSEAIASFETALTIRPDYPEALSNLGAAFYDSGRPEEAAACLEKAVAIRPDFAEAQMNLGNALTALGRQGDAVPRFEKALALRLDYAEAEMNLGRTLVELGRPDEAITHLERALRLNPDLPEAHVNLGNALMARERHDEALACFEKALLLRPGFAGAEMSCGIALLSLRRRGEALARFEQAVALQPDSADAQMHLGVGLSMLDRNEEAIARFERALELRSDFAEGELNLGKALLAENRQDEAIAHFEKALALKPDLDEAMDSLGGALQEIGRIAEARIAFERVLARNPRRTQSHLFLANAATVASGDPHLAALEALARDMTSFSGSEQVHLHFALGKALADTGEHDRSFRHYLEGNALVRRLNGYDEAASLARLERIRTVFTAEFMTRLRGNGDPSRSPIFVIGMPRSGSTLVEQMLASHPKIFAGGERLDFRQSLQLCGLDSRKLRYPEGMATLDGAQIRALGETYLQRIEAACAAAARDSGNGAAAERITDKLLANFLYAGLVHLALPNARIIHTCRDPIETCLSCFSILFFGDQPHAYDLGELGRYYRGYAALMDQWRRVLPTGVMLDVRYEDMVTDFEAQSRRIVAHCGLDWDDRCLAFHETKRPIRTASLLQVRQPLYRSSLKRWRPDDATLQPLLSGLGQAGA